MSSISQAACAVQSCVNSRRRSSLVAIRGSGTEITRLAGNIEFDVVIVELVAIGLVGMEVGDFEVGIVRCCCCCNASEGEDRSSLHVV